MKKGALLWLMLLILAFSVSAVSEKINSIVRYAELYELGKINYMQLIVYGSAIREEINIELGHEYQVEEDWTQRGLTEEDVKKVFGTPTETTHWIRIINEDREEYVDEPLPTWEQRLFDGRKIKIIFNAWPHMIKKDKTVRFYEVDFDILFKTNYDFDIDNMLKDIKNKATQFLEDRADADELLIKSSEYQSLLQSYLEENSDDCKNTMRKFFDADNKMEEQRIVRFAVNAYEGKNLLLKIMAEACESCEWPHVNMWFDIEARGKGFEYEPDRVISARVLSGGDG
jgi:hypothetical protein